MWFVSDFHFNHRNIIAYCKRPFSSVDEMNDVLVKNFFNTVPKGDICFLLGDLWDVSYLLRLAQNRKIILVLGNHDKQTKKLNQIQSIISTNHLDVEVYKYPILVNKYLWCSHEPIEDMSKSNPYINIHGHLHDKIFENGGSFAEGNRYFNVSVECIDYKPIHISEIVSRMGIESDMKIRLLNEPGS